MGGVALTDVSKGLISMELSLKHSTVDVFISDIPTKQLILHLNETCKIGKFVIKDLVSRLCVCEC